MLGVAAHTILAGVALVDLRGVETARGSQALRNLGMTLQAAERDCPRPEFVTTGTLRGPVQGLMRAGQGAGRKLGRSSPTQQHENSDSSADAHRTRKTISPSHLTTYLKFCGVNPTNRE